MNMSLSAYVKEEDVKNRRNQMPFLDRAEALADYYFSEFEKLKNATENLVDEFVKLYKETKGGSHV